MWSRQTSNKRRWGRAPSAIKWLIQTEKFVWVGNYSKDTAVQPLNCCTHNRLNLGLFYRTVDTIDTVLQLNRLYGIGIGNTAVSTVLPREWDKCYVITAVSGNQMGMGPGLRYYRGYVVGFFFSRTCNFVKCNMYMHYRLHCSPGLFSLHNI